MESSELEFPSTSRSPSLPPVLSRKDWRPENIVLVMIVVVISWLMSMVVAMLLAASRKEQGLEPSPIVTLAVVGCVFHGMGLVAVAGLLHREHRTWREAFGLALTPLRAVTLAIGGTVVV